MTRITDSDELLLGFPGLGRGSRPAGTYMSNESKAKRKNNGDNHQVTNRGGGARYGAVT
jgi:hypothetical protein